jgi:hypothetical protein
MDRLSAELRWPLADAEAGVGLRSHHQLVAGSCPLFPVPIL